MHPDVVKKMNETIALLKLIERETAILGDINDKRIVTSRRSSEVQNKILELDIIIASNGTDENTEKFRKQIVDEADRVLNIREAQKFDF